MTITELVLEPTTDPMPCWKGGCGHPAERVIRMKGLGLRCYSCVLHADECFDLVHAALEAMPSWTGTYDTELEARLAPEQPGHD